MRSRIMAIWLALLLLPALAWPAGTVTQTPLWMPQNEIFTLTFAWTSTNPGQIATADTTAAITGAIKGLYLFQAQTIPAAGGDAPTTLYDIVINDTAAADMMSGSLMNRSATLPEFAYPIPAGKPVTGTLSLSVSAAGASKQGTVILYFARSPVPGLQSPTGGSTQYINGAAVGIGTGTIAHALSSTSPVTYATGTVGPVTMTLKGGMRSTLFNDGGTEVGLAATPLYVQNSTAGFTVLPGNTANTTAWLVTGTGGTFPATQSTSPWIVAGGGTAGAPGTAVLTVQGIGSGTAIPISAASLPLPSGASTSALQGAGLPAALGAGLGLKVDPLVKAETTPALIVAGTYNPLSSDLYKALWVRLTTSAGGVWPDPVADVEHGVARTNPPIVISGDEYDGTHKVSVPHFDTSGNGYSIQQAGTTGGCTPGSWVSAGDDTDYKLISTGAHQLYWAYITNTATTVAFVKIYDHADAPAPATETPTLRLGIPGATAGAGGQPQIVTGAAFAAGLGFIISPLIADADATHVAAGAVVVNYCYK